MFIGHFAAGFAAKSVAPKLSLGLLFIAAQFVDLLWPTLLLFGVEQVQIVPGATVVTPLIFEDYPVSHSLLAVVLWGVLLGGGYYLLRRDRIGAALLMLLVVSHWTLDTLVHQPDLPLLPGSDFMVGLNAWSSLPLTLLIELSLFTLGVWLYLRVTEAIDRVGVWALWGLILFLLTIYAGNLFGEPPPNVEMIAWVGHAQWLLVLWGFWIDRHRRVTIDA
ncbi:hypothetical protein BOW53_06940 [Solemya pervernicosa gill symbiont]|uniref:Permease n=2 Tax=Gammaproteobacteria incertae sedis TaxID=118884 RepID=A0A1T2L6C4_9GAMM|nr:hypothetical protein [Candidatus Reidiella endopervernicosa]OOZ40658.1 hypothetical protein BOW53_06940 [Solemya pervernicosa gill symbiont]QKQ27412.1 hypothetical protein HUE57_14825 [Candidatus Reidiella endopervernicosa]